ncbi:four-carbon acid sugar kinase family protein [Tropicimonas sp. TH_r6]|uniref:four-carbon acid sugar kinase family protein n=1 Tax=Tropicimonas sp. TH_r6 TaxID=3082085 RepID=UPI002953C25D|nr:four-carbon acid sugar kinase family protein [Tropicimonas sp. TH_r6]MDV7142703.1 four-carbon acid sugar kinase family protein [Tropicimonas sp. TH_r6]
MDGPRNAESPLGAGCLVAWYGDDFTGAAAVMEVLTFSGLPAILFLDVPSPEQLARFPELRAIGVASTARTQPPDWMDRTLPDIFKRLKALGPELIHYKVCSTLDSSPVSGSIGRAMEIGADSLATTCVPVLVAAPKMRRYQCFGHLFAGMDEEVVRLDRHPVMSRHPVTPMDESDVARHIARQSDRLETCLLSLEDLARGTGLEKAPPLAPGRLCAVSIDTMDSASDAAAGRAIWEARATSPFVIGSQGVEYALVEHWCQSGLLDRVAPPTGLGRSAGMMSVSGSVSPTTAAQIAWSTQNGFEAIAFDASRVCHGKERVEREIARVVDASLSALSDGKDPLVHTAEGPDDPAVTRFRAALAETGTDPQTANRTVGEALGTVLKRVLERSDIRRAIVSGGDSSGFATQKLGIFALSALAPTIPGASIFRAHSDGPMDGLELALKGGQMGSPDYFAWVRDGGGPR